MRTRWYGRDTGLTVRMAITMLLLLAVYGVFLGVLYQSGVGMMTMAIVAGGFLLAQYFLSDQLVLWTTGSQIVDESQAPDLHGLVDRMCTLADMPKPRLAIMRTPMANAFATGRSPGHSVVCVTTGLMDQLTRPELEAVVAHELSHIKNRDVMVMTIASFLSTVAYLIVRFSFWFGPIGGRRERDGAAAWGAIAYVVAIVVWFLSMMLTRLLSRYRELAADRGAAIITGAPSQLSSALLKISGRMQRIPEQDLRDVQGANAFFILPAVKGSSILELFSTHPSLESRLKRLRELELQIEGH